MNQFLDDYPGMSIAPCRGMDLQLKGKFDFEGTIADGPKIVDSYFLKIAVPRKFPRALPNVEETAGKIPRDGNHHVNLDGSLCLGSPFRLLKQIYKKSDLSGFAEMCIVPYLYSISHKIKNGGDFPFGDLVHGEQGIIDDYLELFDLKERFQVTEAIRLLGIKKRIANKQDCPCGCGQRLGACQFRIKLNEFRNMAPVSWFKAHS